MSKAMPAERKMWSRSYTYDDWMERQGIPIYRGYYIEDLRTLQLGWWDARQCNAAFIQLVGQEGITSARVTEIPPGKNWVSMVSSARILKGSFLRLAFRTLK